MHPSLVWVQRCPKSSLTTSCTQRSSFPASNSSEVLTLTNWGGGRSSGDHVGLRPLCSLTPSCLGCAEWQSTRLSILEFSRKYCSRVTNSIIVINFHAPLRLFLHRISARITVDIRSESGWIQSCALVEHDMYIVMCITTCIDTYPTYTTYSTCTSHILANKVRFSVGSCKANQ